MSMPNEKPNRINELMLALIAKNLEPPNGKYRIIDAFTARNLPEPRKAQEKADDLRKAWTKVSSKPPKPDPKNKKALPAYTFEQLGAAVRSVKSECTEEELEVILSYSWKQFSKSYDDGHYTGELSSSKERVGQGIFEYENGQRYMGEWKNDRFHGSGTYTLNDGATFSGEWRNGKQVYGTFLWPEPSLH